MGGGRLREVVEHGGSTVHVNGVRKVPAGSRVQADLFPRQRFQQIIFLLNHLIN